MYAEFGFSDIGATDVSRDTGIPMKSLRGVISSLVQKGHVSPLEDRSDEWGYRPNDPSWESIIYLSGDAVGLVQRWVENEGIEAAVIGE